MPLEQSIGIEHRNCTLYCWFMWWIRLCYAQGSGLTKLGAESGPKYMGLGQCCCYGLISLMLKKGTNQGILPSFRS